ncbi:MAG: NYN domain-containing protein [Actinomycetaceae bacterium]
MDPDERMAVFLDYENLALGARDHLGGMTFDFGPIADALAVRGRTLTRRAYADWSFFDEDRRMLTRHQVELIEMPQRMGASRKNAADIKMVVDAIEMAFERDYVSTFVLCTGDSDFSPLVQKLRELDKRVIGVGVEDSTSRLLPPACDEFLFYDRLEGVEPGDEPPRRRRPATRRPAAQTGAGGAVERPAAREDDGAASSAGGAGSSAGGTGSAVGSAGSAPGSAGSAAGAASGGERSGRSRSSGEISGRELANDSLSADELESDGSVDGASSADEAGAGTAIEPEPLEVRVAQTISGLSSASDSVTASVLKRALLRKDPTFSESDLGFRSFGEVLRHLADRGIVELSPGPATGDPEVALAERGGREEAFTLLVDLVDASDGPVPLSGLKDAMRKRQPGFSEKSLGYRGFLQFCKGAQADGRIHLEQDEDGNYLVTR